MLGNFTYYNPTKLYFGKNALDNLEVELSKYGKNILFIYGQNSIKKNGLYDKIFDILIKCGKNIYEISGVMPNPTKEKVVSELNKLKNKSIDLILCVGGGSVIDYAKAFSAAYYLQEDFFEKYFIRQEPLSCKHIHIGCILTLHATGSEMNSNSVILDTKTKDKLGADFGGYLNPEFAILNPEFTYGLDKEHMASGIFDIVCHLLEEYFSNSDNNTTDYIIEGLLRSVFDNSRVAIKDMNNYEARSNIMWSSTWALNGLSSCAKEGDWMVHMMGHAVGAYTNAPHGLTLAAVSIPYYKYIYPYGLNKFANFAKNVWNIDDTDLSKDELAKRGIEELNLWMKEIGVDVRLRDLGLKKEDIKEMSQKVKLGNYGYKSLCIEEVEALFNDAY